MILNKNGQILLNQLLELIEKVLTNVIHLLIVL